MAKMPKKNNSKDNPYTLDFDEVKNTYTVEFVDNKKVIHKVEISERRIQDEMQLDLKRNERYRGNRNASQIAL